MSKRREEKTKLAAAFLNACAITVLNLGCLAPFFAYIFNLGNFRTNISLVYLTIFVGLVGLAVRKIYIAAQRKLNELPDDK